MNKPYLILWCYQSVIVVLSGVPHGSIVSPLVFNVFITSIVKSLNVPLLLYVDDIKIYYKIKILQDYIVLQKNLNQANSFFILTSPYEQCYCYVMNQLLYYLMFLKEPS